MTTTARDSCTLSLSPSIPFAVSCSFRPSLCLSSVEFLVDVNEDTVAAAASWCQTLECSGGTNTLYALQVALSDKSIDSVYLLSDGLPDDSTQHILRQVKALAPSKHVKVQLHFDEQDSFMACVVDAKA